MHKSPTLSAGAVCQHGPSASTGGAVSDGRGSVLHSASAKLTMRSAVPLSFSEARSAVPCQKSDINLLETHN